MHTRGCPLTDVHLVLCALAPAGVNIDRWEKIVVRVLMKEMQRMQQLVDSRLEEGEIRIELHQLKLNKVGLARATRDACTQCSLAWDILLHACMATHQHTSKHAGRITITLKAGCAHTRRHTHTLVAAVPTSLSWRAPEAIRVRYTYTCGTRAVRVRGVIRARADGRRQAQCPFGGAARGRGPSERGGKRWRLHGRRLHGRLHGRDGLSAIAQPFGGAQPRASSGPHQAEHPGRQGDCDGPGARLQGGAQSVALRPLAPFDAPGRRAQDGRAARGAGVGQLSGLPDEYHSGLGDARGTGGERLRAA